MQGELQGPEGRGAKGVRAESIPSPQPGLGRRGSGTGVTGCPIVGPRVNGRAVSIHLIGWIGWIGSIRSDGWIGSIRSDWMDRMGKVEERSRKVLRFDHSRG